MLFVQDVSGLPKPRTASVSPPVFHECLLAPALLFLYFHSLLISTGTSYLSSSTLCSLAPPEGSAWVGLVCETVNLFLHIYALQSAYTGCVVKQHVDKSASVLCQCLQRIYLGTVLRKKARAH